jgi:hypothetical protein
VTVDTLDTLARAALSVAGLVVLVYALTGFGRGEPE